VYAGGTVLITKVGPGLVAPMVKVMKPPLLPGNETSGPFTIEITVPGFATRWKSAGEKDPMERSMISGVDERIPPAVTVTVPPDGPWVNVPKLSIWGVTVTSTGLGGGSWAFNSQFSEKKSITLRKTKNFIIPIHLFCKYFIDYVLVFS
jgi:hypothetical protein